MNTSQLQPGQQVILRQYHQSNSYSQQLTAIGLTPGTLVQVVRRAPLGDPIEIQFRGINLALRQSECQGIDWEQA
ncbi:FeoA family protein [Salinibius halmophilus]|uniref:FeoA family protein n=1 Tax=Salinibius halmophilus TaxID=1853216 RepID=UPI000E661024|nr:ferrous iron transport protein A [Salinibius halmophilus]